MYKRALLITSFLQFLAVAMLQRGVFFYTKSSLGFSDVGNLWFGVFTGVACTAGAFSSHAIANRIGERRLVILALLGILLVTVTAMLFTLQGLMIIPFVLIGLFNGWHWPVIESYVTAGKTSGQMLRAVGQFCIAWSLGLPVAVMLAGPLIDTAWPESIFAVSAFCQLIVLYMLWQLPSRPEHTADDHPDLPDDHRTLRYSELLRSSRWCLFSSFALLALLTPMLPAIFAERLGLSNTLSTPLVSLMDWMRVGVFVCLILMTVWYGRALPIAVGAVLIPTGFVMILMVPTLSWVIAGMLIFGLTSGLYYAMAIKNASVKASGAHEMLISMSFTIGPIVGLFGLGLQEIMGDPFNGILVCEIPLILISLAGGMIPMVFFPNASLATVDNSLRKLGPDC